MKVCLKDRIECFSHLLLELFECDYTVDDDSMMTDLVLILLLRVFQLHVGTCSQKQFSSKYSCNFVFIFISLLKSDFAILEYILSDKRRNESPK